MLIKYQAQSIVKTKCYEWMRIAHIESLASQAVYDQLINDRLRESKMNAHLFTDRNTKRMRRAMRLDVRRAGKLV